jgi:hypothetical protein
MGGLNKFVLKIMDSDKLLTAVAYLKQGIIYLEKELAYSEKVYHPQGYACIISNRVFEKECDIKDQIKAFQFVNELLIMTADNTIRVGKMIERQQQ